MPILKMKSAKEIIFFILGLFRDVEAAQSRRELATDG